jgi:hypothetical protein
MMILLKRFSKMIEEIFGVDVLFASAIKLFLCFPALIPELCKNGKEQNLHLCTYSILVQIFGVF